MTAFVYTDGACSNNGRKNAKAGIGVYFGENDDRNISKRIDGLQTNNRAELTAVIAAYHKIKSELDLNKDITIVTDSNYVIKCVGSYGEKCFNNNWSSKTKKEIPNVDLLKEAYMLYKDTNVTFLHVRAHTGLSDTHSLGNAEADRLANLSIGHNVSNQKKNHKVYLKNVTYEKKEDAKKLGARWDPKKKKWYCMEDNCNIDELLAL